jgi:hypothetical protein
MKANINNQVLTIEVINSNYNNHASEVKILEGTFSGKCAIVENSDLITDKYTVSFKAEKYESENSYEKTLELSNNQRYLDFNLEIKSENEDTANYIFDKIANYIESELKSEYGFEFARCTGYDKDYQSYVDTASINFEHGFMVETKKAIMTAYKEAKKSLK